MLKLKEDAILCCLITDDLIARVVACLARGFPSRSSSYWVCALDQMSRREIVEDYPRYGYALEAKGQIVGVLLLIYSRRDGVGGGRVYCNLSSWCVDVEYRGSGCALLLHTAAVRHREVTYLNISPAEFTRPAIEALGFQRFARGQIFSAPILSSQSWSTRVRTFSVDRPESALLTDSERKILADHAALGCCSLVCVKDGAAYPFVFRRRVVFRFILCSHLIYSRSIDEFVRFAGPLGRYLMLRSGPFCVLDTNGAVSGVVGRYFSGRNPKYFKGPVSPRLGDLTYTELALFGA